jgi:hypothetical protein|tara:strand:- start:12692 stop:13714 length:1023 start_codon:yes stop_codon:yes gene_type:complete
MAEKLGTGLQGETESSGFSFSLSGVAVDEEAALAAASAALLAAFDEPTEEQTEAAAVAIGTSAALGPALALALPLAFDIDTPEIALPAAHGSHAEFEGDAETIATFTAVTEAAEEQASMGDAVFNTLDPILNGIPVGEDGLVYSIADAAISAAGITDNETVPPIPNNGTPPIVPTIARMQLFEEIAYGFRRSGMAAGASDPEAPGKILAAYISLAVEKFVRRAIIKVSLPDDNYIKLLSKLTEFGSGTAKVSNSASVLAAEVVPADPSVAPYVGSYAFDPADLMLGVDVVPLLNFYGGIGRLKDYGDNFEHPDYVADGAEAKMVNMDSVLMMLENGINFV